MNLYKVIFVIIFAAVTASACDMLYDEKSMLDSAIKHQENGKHREAIIELKKILKHNASNKNARITLARSYIETSQGKSAEKELSFAVKHGVEMSDVIGLMARAYLLQQNYNKVLTDAPLSLAKSPIQKARLMLLHGYAYAALKNKKKSIELFKKVKETNLLPADSNIALSQVALTDRNLELAVSLINEAIKIDGENTKAWLQKGEIYLSAGEINNAKDAFERVVSITKNSTTNRQNFQAIIFLTQVALVKKDMALARNWVEKLINIAPSHPMVLYFSGLVDYQEKNYDRAKIALEKILTIVPGDLKSKLLLGGIHYAKGNYEQANKNLTYFVENVPTHIHARKLLGAVRLKMGQHQGALNALRPISENSKDSQLLAMIGKASVLSNEFQQAQDYYRRALESDPGNQLLKNELARIYLGQGLVSEAINELKNVSGQGRDNAKKLLIIANVQKNDFETARQLVSEVISEGKNNPSSYSMAGIVEFYAGEKITARKYLARSIELDANHVPGLLMLANLHFEDGELEKAKDLYKKVVMIDGNNMKAMLSLSALASRENNIEEALNWLNSAKDKNPEAVEPRIVLSKYYIKLKQPKRAVEILSASSIKDYDKSRTLPLLITSYIMLRQLKEALITARQLIKIEPKSPISYLQMARVQIALKENLKSEQYFKKALELRPDFLPANMAYASFKIIQGEYAAAHKITKQIIQKSPNLVVGYNIQGKIFLLQKQYSKAIESYKKAHSVADSSGTIISLAKAYEANGEQKKAIQLLEQWLKDNAKDKSVRLNLAVHYEKSEKSENAIKQYHIILDDDPDNIVVLNNMALSYMRLDISKAMQYAERAYELNSNVPAIKDTLGWIAYKSGNKKRARDLLEDASQKSQNPSILYHYGVILNDLGKKQQAREVLTKLFEHNVSGFPEEKEARHLLDSTAK